MTTSIAIHRVKHVEISTGRKLSASTHQCFKFTDEQGHIFELNAFFAPDGQPIEFIPLATAATAPA